MYRRSLRTVGIVICVALAVGLVSCLPAPIGEPGQSKVDPQLVGYWLNQPKDGKRMMALVAPFDEHAYVIHLVEYKSDDGKVSDKEHMVLKGWLTEIKGEKLLCTEVVEQLVDKDNKDRTYPTLRVRLKDDTLTSASLKPDSAALKGMKTTAELTEAITKNLDQAEMYDEEQTWKRLDPAKDDDLIRSVMK